MAKFIYSTEMDAFIREHYLLVASELAAKFNAEFGTSLTAKQLHGARKVRGLKTGRTGRFYKGQARIPGSGAKGATSTSFKKGERPHNWKPVGSERINVDGYIEIKTAEPKTWKLKQRVLWTKHRGAIPEGHVVRFKDGNPLNVVLENLILVSHACNARLTHRYHYNQQPDEVKPTLEALAKLDTKIAEIQEHNDG